MVVTCTEATASRDYMPGLTKAYYHKLPLLAVTGVHGYSEIGHLHPQVIDRSVSPKDIFNYKAQLHRVKSNEDFQENEIMINQALLECSRGGTAHIDLPCTDEAYSFSTLNLPDVRMIRRYFPWQVLPEIPKGRIVVFIGTHVPFDEKTTESIDNFCASRNAVVFSGKSSGYYGKYRVESALAAFQKFEYGMFGDIGLLVHIGEQPADEATVSRLQKISSHVWRVSQDGELRDPFHKLENVFAMSERIFFDYYCKSEKNNVYFKECTETVQLLDVPANSLPFSNVFAAAVCSQRMPKGSFVFLGASNTIRAWSLFRFQAGVKSSSNMGCRGIDGILSTFLGIASVACESICYCVLGDLSFFYDMNSLNNTAILGSNVRVLLVNNNGGGVFKLSGAPGHRFFGDEMTNQFVAAGGHWGNQSSALVKHYAENLGFEYMGASTKEEFLQQCDRFLSPEMTEKPMLLEIFTKDCDERNAFDIAGSLKKDAGGNAKDIAKVVIKSVAGEKGIHAVKNQ